MNDHGPHGPDTAGVRVRRTGIALVHAGELILPDAGSAADLEPSLGHGAGVTQFVFPVEVEVLSPPEPADPQQTAELTLAQLAASLGTF